MKHGSLDETDGTLSALLEVLAPGAVGQPSAGDLALTATLARRTADDPLWRDLVRPGLTALDDEALTRGVDRFARLDESVRRRVVDDAANGVTTATWNVDPARWLAVTAATVMQVYYADPSPAWAALGYDPSPKRAPGAPVVERTVRLTPVAALTDAYDVVVVGSGAGGGVAAEVLARAGASVLVLERGPAQSVAEIGRDHVANHRFPRFGLNTAAPAPAERRITTAGGRELDLGPAEPGFHANPWVVGGGTRVYQGMAWRFSPTDFRMASRHGVPDGSSLADWPITYDDLEPWYGSVEWSLGVCGDAAAHPNAGPRLRPYPMPPMPLTREGSILAAAARHLGWSTGPVPLLINSVPNEGRAQCVQCGTCVGFACPVDAKNGTFNVSLPAAQRTGRCTVATHARVARITTDHLGRVNGVELIDAVGGTRRTIRAGHVVVAAGAIESARLLLTSRSDHHPDGLGNHADMVGRNLQGHVYVGAFGLFDEPVQDLTGPGVSIATCDFLDGDPTTVGGGVLANEVVKMPAMFYGWALPPGAARWGRAAHEAMANSYLRTAHVFGPIQEIPDPSCRVTLSDRTDRHGVPLVRLEGRVHPESIRSAERHAERAVTWMRATNAREVWSSPSPVRTLSAGQHQAGTCRMGDDPRTSVTDRHGQVHGHRNLWVMDASLHVTNGGVNPVLTIMALAAACASELAGR